MIRYYALQYSILGIHLWTLNQVLSGLMKVITDIFLSDLQRAVDEKFRCVEEKEEETRRLQLLLREKERDLERQRCVLANNEETITVRTHQITRLLSLPPSLSLWRLIAVSVCVSESGGAGAWEGSGAGAGVRRLEERPAAAAGQRGETEPHPEGAGRHHQPAAGGAARSHAGGPGTDRK